MDKDCISCHYFTLKYVFPTYKYCHMYIAFWVISIYNLKNIERWSCKLEKQSYRMVQEIKRKEVFGPHVQSDSASTTTGPNILGPHHSYFIVSLWVPFSF